MWLVTKKRDTIFVFRGPVSGVEGRKWERGGGMVQRQFENILKKETNQTVSMNKGWSVKELTLGFTF